MPSATGLYRPRRPELTALHRLVSENLATIFDVYDERFLECYGPLADRARRALSAFLECGLPEYGFARIRCDDCHEERFLAFSCQLRGVCPSCNAKRMGVWSRFMLDDAVEDVPHRLTLDIRAGRGVDSSSSSSRGSCAGTSRTTPQPWARSVGRPRSRWGSSTRPAVTGPRPSRAS